MILDIGVYVQVKKSIARVRLEPFHVVGRLTQMLCTKNTEVCGGE